MFEYVCSLLGESLKQEGQTGNWQSISKKVIYTSDVKGAKYGAL